MKFATAGVLHQTTTNSAYRAWGLLQLLLMWPWAEGCIFLSLLVWDSVEGSVLNLLDRPKQKCQAARPGLIYHPARVRGELQLCYSAREKSKWIPFGSWVVDGYPNEQGTQAEQQSLGNSPWIRAGRVSWPRLSVKGGFKFLRHEAARCWFLLAVWKNC